MTFRRLAAVALIFFGTAAAWTALGSSLLARTGEFDNQFEHEVRQLWGAPQQQMAPDGWVEHPGTDIEVQETKDASGHVTRTEVTKAVVRKAPAALESTRAAVDLQLEHRQRGLLWYPTYAVAFKGSYVFRNPDPEPRQLRVHLTLPADAAIYDDLQFTINGMPALPGGDVSHDLTGGALTPPGGTVAMDVQYRSRGLRTWTYALGTGGIARVRDFNLTMQTNFTDVDFPLGSMSPTTKASTNDGWSLTWTFANVISGQTIGMVLPQKLNPGPFAARVTFFAPVSLLFFLAVMVMFGATTGQSLHPMHYWFIAAAFFAFHLLLAYSVDHLSIHTAFAISAAVSMTLVITYLRAVRGMQGVLPAAAAAQAIFLVLFSYAFFFEGFTGLTITIGAIITLAVLMQVTARVSWDEVFAVNGRA